MVEKAWLPCASQQGNVGCSGVLVSAHEESPPTDGQATGRKSGAGDRWLWNRNETTRPDR